MRPLWSNTHQRCREKNALLLINQGPHHDHHLFQKKSYGTWIHPRSKFPHQLDHIIKNKDKLCTITDVGVTESMVDSDHRALKCKFRLQMKLAKRPPPPPLCNLNLAKLQSQETSTEFCEKVTASINQQSTITDPPTSTHTTLAEAINTTAPSILGKVGRNEPGWFQEASNILEPLIERRNTAFAAHTSNPSR